MRTHGLVDLPGDVGPDGHACWAYDDVSVEFAAAATAFLREGLDLGQRLMFVGGPAAEEVVRELDPMCSWVDDGMLQVAPFEAVYPGGRRLPKRDQWAAYAGATEQALADGFTGLRVLAEVTSLVGPGSGWHDHAGWESYADRLMATGKLSALCCFDRGELSPHALAAIASAHPVADRRLHDLVPFQLFGSADALALVGEVDAFSSETLACLLRAQDGDDLLLDLSELRFIDHTGVRAIEEHARVLGGSGRRLTVRGAPPTFRRLAPHLETT